MSPLSRRQLLTLGAGGLLLPRGLSATPPAPTASARRFLFVFVQGGWDTTCVFTPMLDNPYVAPEEGATLAEAGGIPFVDRATRPAVRSFFETWAPYTAVLNGVEVRSVTHERCRQIALTGSAGTGRDDWPSLLAAGATQELICPYLVIDGVSFTSEYTANVVRVGDRGQILHLLDGSALASSTQQLVEPLPEELGALGDRYLSARLDALVTAGLTGRRGELYRQALEREASLRALVDGLNLTPAEGGCSRDLATDAATAFDCFQLGVSRCAMIRHQGWCEQGWDTHEINSQQDVNYEDLFQGLNALMGDLSAREGAAGGSLLEEVCVVVFSEMGRHPRLNARMGKDHWTFTSAMLLGAGVRGGQSIGGLDERGLGLSIDPSSGEASASGLALTAQDLGATLLALGDVDPEAYGVSGVPIGALMA